MPDISYNKWANVVGKIYKFLEAKQNIFLGTTKVAKNFVYFRLSAEESKMLMWQDKTKTQPILANTVIYTLVG